jgi:hypothetical protein
VGVNHDFQRRERAVKMEIQMNAKEPKALTVSSERRFISTSVERNEFDDCNTIAVHTGLKENSIQF